MKRAPQCVAALELVWRKIGQQIELAGLRPAHHVHPGLQPQFAMLLFDFAPRDIARQLSFLEVDVAVAIEIEALEQRGLILLPLRQQDIHIGDAVKDSNTSATFLLGDRYIHAMQQLSASENSKIVVLPSDLVEAVKTLLGGK